MYAKESGFVQKLNVDYGTHVKEGDVMAVLEIPELQAQLDEDQAEINDAASQIDREKEELDSVQAQEKVAELEYTRFSQVAKSTPGLVAQQEVDDRQGKDLAAQAQVASARAVLQSAQSQLARAQAKQRHDQFLFDYSKIPAPFTGVVTKRYARDSRRPSFTILASSLFETRSPWFKARRFRRRSVENTARSWCTLTHTSSSPGS